MTDAKQRNVTRKKGDFLLFFFCDRHEFHDVYGTPIHSHEGKLKGSKIKLLRCFVFGPFCCQRIDPPLSAYRYSRYVSCMKKEADVLKEILDYLKKLGLACYRSPNMPVLRGGVGNMYLSKAAVQGLPDITGVIYGGRAIYIEVKAPGIGKLPFEMNEEELTKYYARKAKSKDAHKDRREEQQSRFLTQMQKAGALCMIARSVEDVKKALLDAGYFTDVDADVH